jgi:hypothetical protein
MFDIIMIYEKNKWNLRKEKIVFEMCKKFFDKKLIFEKEFLKVFSTSSSFKMLKFFSLFFHIQIKGCK